MIMTNGRDRHEPRDHAATLHGYRATPIIEIDDITAPDHSA
jgi:hypothetical protein